MSVAEIKTELKKLTPAELAEVEAALQQAKATTVATETTDPAQFFGSLAGVMKFGPGWDEPAPAGAWHAMRDDTPL